MSVTFKLAVFVVFCYRVSLRTGSIPFPKMNIELDNFLV